MLHSKPCFNYYVQYSFPVRFDGTKMKKGKGKKERKKERKNERKTKERKKERRKERKKEGNKKKRRWTKLKILCLVFSTLLKLSGTSKVD